MVSLRTVMELVDVSFSMLMYYNEHIMKSNLPPSWTHLVLTSLCHVLWLYHSFNDCALPLPSCFSEKWYASGYALKLE